MKKFAFGILAASFAIPPVVFASGCELSTKTYQGILDRLNIAAAELGWKSEKHSGLIVNCTKNDQQIGKSASDNTIRVPAHFILFSESVDGIAGVLAHELTHFYKHEGLVDTRKIEDEADIGAVELLVTAGYSPYGIVDALKAFCDYKHDSRLDGDCGESENHASVDDRKKIMTDYILKSIKKPKTTRQYLDKATIFKIMGELEPGEIPGLSQEI